MTRTSSVDDFVTRVIFELRQPMTAIQGEAQRAQLLVFTDPDRADEAMRRVIQQIARIDRLLDELRDRARRAGADHLVTTS